MAIEGWRRKKRLLVVVLHVLLLEVLPLALERVLAVEIPRWSQTIEGRTPWLMEFQTLLEALSKALQMS